ncbi:hypothetical protein RB213_010371, partial [Colletotrichum asianum]
MNRRAGSPGWPLDSIKRRRIRAFMRRHSRTEILQEETQRRHSVSASASGSGTSVPRAFFASVGIMRSS